MKKVVVTCEHAGNEVPAEYERLFDATPDVLHTHRGWDEGSLAIGRYLSNQLSAPLYAQPVTRLLVEMNRSVDNPELFSDYSRHLLVEEKQVILDRFYLPYRDEVEYKIRHLTETNAQVIHLSVHTFTPVFDGIERQVEIGLLCDEELEYEAEFCNIWKRTLERDLPQYLTMVNLPYNGADDGFTTYLRTRFPSAQYLGIELEVNQKYVGTKKFDQIQKALSRTLLQLLD